MSTLEAGRPQGVWGCDWRLRVLFTLLAPVRLALRVRRALECPQWCRCHPEPTRLGRLWCRTFEQTIGKVLYDD